MGFHFLMHYPGARAHGGGARGAVTRRRFLRAAGHPHGIGLVHPGRNVALRISSPAGTQDPNPKTLRIQSKLLKSGGVDALNCPVLKGIAT
jgi:hypothetical protein